MSLSDLTDQGYIETERSADALTSETFDEQSTAAGLFYEFFPLSVALLGVAYIRAKFLLGMGFFASLKHTSSLKFVEQGLMEVNTAKTPEPSGSLSGWWKRSKTS